MAAVQCLGELHPPYLLPKAILLPIAVRVRHPILAEIYQLPLLAKFERGMVDSRVRGVKISELPGPRRLLEGVTKWSLIGWNNYS